MPGTARMPLDPRILGNFLNYRPVIPVVRRLSWSPISDSAQGGLAFKCIGAIGAVVARFVHTEEVTGSNPVSPTDNRSVSAPKERKRTFFMPGFLRRPFCQPLVKESLYD